MNALIIMAVGILVGLVLSSVVVRMLQRVERVSRNFALPVMVVLAGVSMFGWVVFARSILVGLNSGFQAALTGLCVGVALIATSALREVIKRYLTARS